MAFDKIRKTQTLMNLIKMIIEMKMISLLFILAVNPSL
jgi:competence protein ComGC